MSDPIPYDEIRDREDRSWTLRLCAVAVDDTASVPARVEAVEALERLDDRRALPALQRLFDDPATARDLRSAACDALAGIEPSPEAAQRRAWWASGDELLMNRAMHAARREDADFVVPAASAPNHPLRAAAVIALSSCFDSPPFHEVLIDALQHGDDASRRAAAAALLWDEPVAAEPALIAAIRDPDEETATNALEALAYYGSRRTLRALHDAAADPTLSDEVREAADDAFDAVLEMFDDEAADLAGSAQASALFRTWAEPVEDLVTWPTDLSTEPRSPGEPMPRITPPASEVAARILDQDGCREPLRHYLWSIDWSAYSDEGRDEIRAAFVDNADATVRSFATKPLGAWGEIAELHRLATDAYGEVRQSAMYQLGELPERDPATAQLAWEALPPLEGMRAWEALHTYVRHEPDEVRARARLLAIARDDVRDQLRYAAIEELRKLGARDEISALLSLLAEPPYVTWSLHTLLLDAVVALDLPTPPIDHLADVDSLHLQRAVIAVRCRDAVLGAPEA